MNCLWCITLFYVILICLSICLLLTLSAPSQFLAPPPPKKKKKKFLKKFYNYFSFYVREKNFKYFFLSSWLNCFVETWKKIENPAKYELFLPKLLTLFWWSFKQHVALKGFKRMMFSDGCSLCLENSTTAIESSTLR